MESLGIKLAFVGIQKSIFYVDFLEFRLKEETKATPESKEHSDIRQKGNGPRCTSSQLWIIQHNKRRTSQSYHDAAAAAVNLSARTSKAAFTQTPPLRVHLVKVFSMLRPSGISTYVWCLCGDGKWEAVYQTAGNEEVFTEQNMTNIKPDREPGETLNTINTFSFRPN